MRILRYLGSALGFKKHGLWGVGCVGEVSPEKTGELSCSTCARPNFNTLLGYPPGCLTASDKLTPRRCVSHLQTEWLAGLNECLLFSSTQGSPHFPYAHLSPAPLPVMSAGIQVTSSAQVPESVFLPTFRSTCKEFANIQESPRLACALAPLSMAALAAWHLPTWLRGHASTSTQLG